MENDARAPADRGNLVNLGQSLVSAKGESFCGQSYRLWLRLALGLGWRSRSHLVSTLAIDLLDPYK
jgi:hypothetical protein